MKHLCWIDQIKQMAIHLRWRMPSAKRLRGILEQASQNGNLNSKKLEMISARYKGLKIFIKSFTCLLGGAKRHPSIKQTYMQ